MGYINREHIFVIKQGQLKVKPRPSVNNTEITYKCCGFYSIFKYHMGRKFDVKFNLSGVCDLHNNCKINIRQY